jgi:leucyl aminopeptidase
MTPKLILSSPENVAADALAIVLFEADGKTKSPGGRYNELTGGLIDDLYASKEFTGKFLSTVLIHRPAGMKVRRLLLVGGGKAGEFTSASLRQAAGAAVRALKDKGCRRLAMAPAGEFSPGDQVQALAEGAILGVYEPDAYKTSSEMGAAVEEVLVLGRKSARRGLERGAAIAEAQNFTRSLVNEPGNVLTPKKLAAAAVDLGKTAGLQVEVLDRKHLEKLKMGALLGVAQGSAEPPVMIVVRYLPKKAGNAKMHLGLVGKAVTFDTGGISIKPAENMEKMKYDMAGGAAVLGAMKALAALKPAVPVTAVIPSVENMPGSRAQRPGDVVTTLSGKTVEVLNTDAEGRLILCDALTYAKQQGCTHLVDAATLTGAIVVALGHVRVGVFSNQDAWRDGLLSSANAAGEKMWPMPLDEEYKEQLKSIIADLPNIGTRWGGAVTAAMFLKQFADPAPWVHLDIAGTAWLDEPKPYLAKGPTGVGVRTFIDLAMKLKPGSR